MEADTIKRAAKKKKKERKKQDSERGILRTLHSPYRVYLNTPVTGNTIYNTNLIRING